MRICKVKKVVDVKWETSDNSDIERVKEVSKESRSSEKDFFVTATINMEYSLQHQLKKSCPCRTW